MKTKENNNYLYSFYKSGYFLPFIIFTILSISNNYLFFHKTFIDYNWHYFYALWGGVCHDLFFFSLLILALALTSKLLPKTKNIALLVLFVFLTLPIFDYFYFKATLERFNWVVLQFVNYHSARGYIGNMGFVKYYIILAFIAFIVLYWLSCKREKFAEPYSIKFLSAICIFFFFASWFSSNISFSVESNFFGHIKVIEGKNNVLKNLYFGSVYGFLPKKTFSKKNIKFKDYTNNEKIFLENNGFLPSFNKNIKEAVFDKVIVVALESFALEYIHSVNSDIPLDASPYFDYLIKNYPHNNNFYTSDFPSLQGFNVILSSKIPFDEKSKKKQEYNLASIFETKYPGSTWFLRGSSRVYGNEDIAVKTIFGFSNLIGYEDLSLKFKEPLGFVWGYKDEYLYREAFDILSEIKNKNYFMVIKLLNQHQPIFSEIQNASGLPESVRNHPNNIVKAIYDADKLLKEFIESCEKANIIDDKTLVIITADHYPPLGYGHTELIKSDYHFQLGRLPLIFYTKQKEIFKNLKEDELCCQLDIAPTLCELLNFEIPKEYMGQSLLSESFKPRSIGILNNGKVFYSSPDLVFSDSLTSPATDTVVIRKWINNLSAKQ
ncbi:MAG: sulfatase-like hydrolase/transferase [Candidatus Riflebacteria bacterium]|nr:sulfatase-like hydrolase/transferase [Candidatus Riflebacteria bacterium]